MWRVNEGKIRRSIELSIPLSKNKIKATPPLLNHVGLVLLAVHMSLLLRILFSQWAQVKLRSKGKTLSCSSSFLHLLKTSRPIVCMCLSSLTPQLEMSLCRSLALRPWKCFSWLSMWWCYPVAFVCCVIFPANSHGVQEYVQNTYSKTKRCPKHAKSQCCSHHRCQKQAFNPYH